MCATFSVKHCKNSIFYDKAAFSKGIIFMICIRPGAEYKKVKIKVGAYYIMLYICKPIL